MVGFLASSVCCRLPISDWRGYCFGCPAPDPLISTRNTPRWEWVQHVDPAGPAMVLHDMAIVAT